MDYHGQRILLTGGTGSFGRAFLRSLLSQDTIATVCVYSRDEVKQADLRAALGDEPRVRYFLGDVRDRDRLELAARHCTAIVHAAALKQVPALEYNPDEAVKTNVGGAMNVIRVALDTPTVERVLALSTDKACNPVNLYGATKLTAEKLFTAANAYRGLDPWPVFGCVRYGNVAGSRGSVIPIWREAVAAGRPVTITDSEMSRFWFTLDGAVAFAHQELARLPTCPGAVAVPSLPSFRVGDLATALAPDHPTTVVGLRPGEKRHEAMIGPDEPVLHATRGGVHLIHPDGIPGHPYTSDRNDRWLTVADLREALAAIP